MGLCAAGVVGKMSSSVIIACLWVVASAIVAFLPMRRQYIPGVSLLIAAPVLIIWLEYDHGWWLSAIALFAFVSMFRNPLKYFWRKFRGEEVELPK